MSALSPEAAARSRKNAGHSFHGLHDPDPKALSRTMSSWFWMLTRCYNATSGSAKGYHGRGISVCERWHTFKDFVADMGLRPEGKTLDRYPDNDGDYCYSNCRWATPKEQSANSRRPKWRVVNGERVMQHQLAARAGISESAMSRRLARGISPETNPGAIKKIKLRPDDVTAIRCLIEGGNRDEDIARQFSVSRQTIGQIRRGVAWI